MVAQRSRPVNELYFNSNAEVCILDRVFTECD